MQTSKLQTESETDVDWVSLGFALCNGDPSLPQCRNYKELRLWLTIYGGACQRTEEIKHNSHNTTVPWMENSSLVAVIHRLWLNPDAFFVRAVNKKLLCPVTRGIHMRAPRLPPCPPSCQHHLSSYLWEFSGIRFAIGFYLGLHMHFNKKFHWNAKVNCPTTTTKALKREREREWEGKGEHSLVHLSCLKFA